MSDFRDIVNVINDCYGARCATTVVGRVEKAPMDLRRRSNQSPVDAWSTDRTTYRPVLAFVGEWPVVAPRPAIRVEAIGGSSPRFLELPLARFRHVGKSVPKQPTRTRLNRQVLRRLSVVCAVANNKLPPQAPLSHVNQLACPLVFSAVAPSLRPAPYRRYAPRPVIFNSMNGRDQQAIKEGGVMEAATSAEERGMAHLWQAVTEQIADPEGMRVHVMMAQKLLGAGKTCTRLLK